MWPKRIVRRIYRWFSLLSLQNKLVFLYTTLFMIPVFILVFVLSHNFYENVITDTIRENEYSIEMEKILAAMPDNQNIKADKVLEINKNHEVFQSLKEAFENDKGKLDLYTKLLYNQALLIEGLPIQDPVEFTNDICKIMV